MTIRKFAVAAAAFSLAAAPVAAQAAPADRASAPVAESNDLAGNNSIFIALIGILLIVAFAAGAGNNNDPTSP